MLTRERIPAIVLGLTALLALCSYAPLIFPLISISTLGCILTGFVFFRPLRLKIPLVLKPLAPPEVFENEERKQVFERLLVLNGMPLPVSPFPKMTALSISLRNVSLLAGITVSSIVYTCLYLQAGKNALCPVDFPGKIFMAEYLVGYLTVVLLSLALIWVSERRVLRHAAVAMGTRSETTPVDSRWRSFQYSFQDRLGVYHGGYSLDFGNRAREYLVLVLYDSTKPNRSKPSCGFLFHKIEMTDSSQ
jgi:hypothetical protein